MANLVWEKPCLFKAKIETETLSGIKKYYETFEAELQTEKTMNAGKNNHKNCLYVDRVLRLRRNTQWQKSARFDSLLSRAGLGHLGKGWIVRETTTKRLPIIGSCAQAGIQVIA